MTISCFRTFLIFIQSYIFNFCIYYKCFFLYLYIYIYISREISIEHPSVGLASLAQLEKWFPLRGERAHSLKLFCMYDKRFEISKTKWNGGALPKVKIFSTLQVHHLILAFILRNQVIFVYIHKYIHALYSYYELF